MSKRVSGTPEHNLNQVSEILEKDRRQMEGYRCIFEDHSEGTSSWMQPPQVVYRKGTRFCLTSPYWTGDFPVPKRPAAGEEMAAWWRNRLREFGFFVRAIQDGHSLYYIQLPGSMERDGKNDFDITSVKKSELPFRITTWSYWELSPELICRPDLMIGVPEFETVLEENWAEGPPGTLFLRVRLNWAANAHCQSNRRVTVPDECRFWLDPSRDFVAVRHDMVSKGESTRPEVIESTVVESFAQSSSGVWYATSYRNHSKDILAGGEELESRRYLYVDFDVDIPAAMFEPQKPGQRIELYSV